MPGTEPSLSQCSLSLFCTQSCSREGGEGGSRERVGDSRGRGESGEHVLTHMHKPPHCLHTHPVTPTLGFFFFCTRKGNNKHRLSERQVSRKATGLWLPCDLAFNFGWDLGARNSGHMEPRGAWRVKGAEASPSRDGQLLGCSHCPFCCWTLLRKGRFYPMSCFLMKSVTKTPKTQLTQTGPKVNFV